jgi:hypothetical protein
MHRFIHRMILRNSVNAALQRAGVYANDVDANLKTRFKNEAKKWLAQFGESYRINEFTSGKWCDSLDELSRHLEHEFGPYLREGSLKLGIAQKMVSLYLKYRWLLGAAEKKPLFAVLDRGIIRSAEIPNPPNWTQINDRKEYLRAVNAVEDFTKNSGYDDGPSWEAETW